MKYKNFTAGDIAIPGTDPGLAVAGMPGWMWRPRPQARIHGLALSDHETQRDRCRGFIDNWRRTGRFAEAIEFNTLPVIAQAVETNGRAIRVGGKALLTGAHGVRLRNRIIWKKGLEEGQAFDRDLITRLAQASQSEAMNRPLPVTTDPLPDDMVIECRNGHNYYHFLTETLCQLCLAVETGFRGRVRIHAPRGAVKGFIPGFIAALFPELAGQVDFLPGGVGRYDRALLALNTQQLYFMCGEGMMPSIDPLVPRNWRWKGRVADRDAYTLLTMNAFDHNLRLLRERALRLAAGADIRQMPSRIWVSRNPGFSDRRPMGNEGKLLDMLTDLGFRKVVFEDLPPLEQIAMVANADIVVMAHGAGLANMLFARPDATVIELSNQQTMLARFGDFHAHAHAAGCRYISAFCDHNTADPTVVPDMEADGHVGVLVPDTAIARLGAVIRAVIDPALVSDVVPTARLLHDAEAEDLLAPLLERPEAGTDPDLLVWRANLHADQGRPQAALDDLLAARLLAPGRAALLERIVRLANRLGHQSMAREFMALHAREFPERQEGFLADCPWLGSLLPTRFFGPKV